MNIFNIATLIPLLFWALILIMIVYFTIKRLDERGKEDFDERDN